MRPVVADAGHEVAEHVRLGDRAVDVGDDELGARLEEEEARRDHLRLGRRAEVHGREERLNGRANRCLVQFALCLHVEQLWDKFGIICLSTV